MTEDPNRSAETQALAARALVHELYRLIDTGRAATGASLVADDAIFVQPGATFDGREQIAGFLQRREDLVDRHTLHEIQKEQVSIQSDGSFLHECTIVNLVKGADRATYHIEDIYVLSHAVALVDGAPLLVRRVAERLHSD